MLKKVDSKDRESHAHRRVAASSQMADGKLVEMVYEPETRHTNFAVWNGESIRYEREVKIDDAHVIVPYSPENNLIKNRVILLPSEATEYETDEALVAEIQSFIHRYVDVGPLFEKIATYYVLFTWVFDSFNELPYLRFRGDYGSGKTRALLTIGSLCNKPIFASGASSVSPLFRLLDSFRGTLIVDEGDFRMSDEKAELVKILNNGNARGFPVLRVEQNGNGSTKEFNPIAYTVFGPKLFGTRGFFQDRALESRFITEEMGHARLRPDIPINLPSSHWSEATEIRNKLLLFRFRMLHKLLPDNTLLDPSLEPRLNQVLMPLLSVIRDKGTREDLKALARTFQRDIAADRGMDMEAQILEVINSANEQRNADGGLSVNAITRFFGERFGEEYDRKITAHWIGYMIRRKLGLKTEKRHGTYVIAASERAKLERLFERYGVTTTPGDLGDFGDLAQEDGGSLPKRNQAS